MPIFGTNSADILNATGPFEAVFGFVGDDSLSTSFHQGSLFGGSGDDTISSTYAHIDGDVFFSDYINTLSGGPGDDLLNVSLDIQDGAIAANPPATFDNVIDGGVGDDTINIDQFVSVYDYSGFGFLNAFNLHNTITDSFGNNTINIDYGVFTSDLDIASSTSIFLGNGDDSVTYNGGADADNNLPFSDHVYDLGDGQNSLVLSDVAGWTNMTVTSGSGVDHLDIFYGGEEGNDNPVFATFNIDVGAGDDVVDLVTRQFGSNDGGTLQGVIDLGSGDNLLNLDSELGGAFVVTAGDGDDTLTVSTGDVDFYGSDTVKTTIDAGIGDNTIIISDTSLDFPFGGGAIFEVSSGWGNDFVQITGGISNRVETGSGNDTIVLGSGEATVIAGFGADRVVIDKAIFNTDTFDPQDTTTLIGFDLSQGDVVELTGFNLPGLTNGGTISSASDFAEMALAGGDLLSMVQVGADLVLTFDLGSGETGAVKFLDFGVPTTSNPQPSDYANQIYGDDEDNKIAGTFQGDWIEGGDGDDKINGGSGDDYIIPGTGRDGFVLGGTGADIFQFSSGDTEMYIFDFEDGVDQIALASGLKYSDLTKTETNFNGVTSVLFTASNGDRIKLRDEMASDIDESDFIQLG